MTPLDRLLQRWRISMVRPHIEPGARVLDVGCGDAAVYRQVRGIGRYVGIDPAIREEVRGTRFSLMRGCFPDDVPPQEDFDAILLLASIEHVHESVLPRLTSTANALLRHGGKVILTVPDARVDAILKVLAALHLIDADAMRADQHHGFNASATADPFRQQGFALRHRQRFQLGLNNCFVLEKVGACDDAAKVA